MAMRWMTVDILVCVYDRAARVSMHATQCEPVGSRSAPLSTHALVDKHLETVAPQTTTASGDLSSCGKVNCNRYHAINSDGGILLYLNHRQDANTLVS